MLRKLISAVLILSLCFCSVPSAFADASPVTVELGGEIISFDTDPVMINDRVMVPVRAILEAVGATVDWDESDGKVTAKLNDILVEFGIGDTKAMVNGVSSVDMYGGAILKDGRTLVSARFIGEAFGFDVSWDEAESKVIINNGKIKDLGKSYKVVSVWSSGDDGNVAENVTDGNYYTRWSCDANGAQLVLELEESVEVGYVGIACYNAAERQTIVAFDISADGKNFKEVVPQIYTSRSEAMEPVSFGEPKKAKYIRLRGYGNTSNAWNSITELKVYAPQPDGSMPVDMNAPLSITKNYEDLPDEIKNGLKEIDKYFETLPLWLANLYDKESKGFFATLSGRDDPKIKTSIEATSWGINYIKSSFECGQQIPDDIRNDFVNYFNIRQDPKTGLFIDTQGPANDRETARNNAAALNSLNSLKAETLYPHPSKTGAVSDTTGQTATVMPEYMESVDSYIKWVESWDWANSSWTAGDQTQQSLNYVKMLSPDKQREYSQSLIKWFEENQNPETGLWGDKINFNSASGAFKVGLIYSEIGEKLPNPEKIAESVFESYKVSSADNVFYVRNPISILAQIGGMSPQLSEMVQKGILENIDFIAQSIAKFYCPDGAFSSYHQKSMTSFGGVTISHGLFEGDIDGTYMALIARNQIYAIFGVSAPKLKSDDFWDWIYGNKEIPSPYIEEMMDETSSSSVWIDFEDQEAEKGQYTLNSTSTILNSSIADDEDMRDNKVLRLSYNGTQSSGPAFSITGKSTQYKYKPVKRKVVEFKIKFEDNTATNNIYINLGSGGGACAFSFGGNGNQKLTARVDPNQVAYGGTLTSLSSDEWYNIRVEYEINETGTDAQIGLYVDGGLVSKNNYYTNSHIGAAPPAMDNSMDIFYYRAGNGQVYLDDISMYTE